MLRALLLLVLAVTACRGDDGSRDRGRRPDRRMVEPGAPRKGGGAAVGSPRLHAGEAPTLEGLPEGEPGLVLLVVLDTVRADHLGACGYHRPTSPALQALVARGASLTCHAYAPGTWTIPSHATYFTGLDPEDHGLLRKGATLGAAVPTLAEVFAERGYQTVFVSANPVLKDSTGLTRGFQRVRVAPTLVSPLLGDGLTRILREELASVDRSRPLFLFVNVFDAHEPYAAIPEGVGWVPPREPFGFRPADLTEANPYVRFSIGAMDDEEREAWLGRVVDGYDHDVSLADRNLGRLLRTLERLGLGRHGVRLVVTSDHGEHLGEHGLVRHDGSPWEGVARVPFAWWDTTRAEPLVLPEPFSTAHTFELLATGRLPEAPRTPRSVSIDHGAEVDLRFQDAVALWPERSRKLMWRAGEDAAYDLAEDPGEMAPLGIEGGDARALAEAVARFREAKEAAMSRQVDDRVVELLRKLGYTD